MRDLHERTAEVLQEVNESGQGAVLTRGGRIVALISPLAGEQVEAAAVVAAIEASTSAAATFGETESDHAEGSNC